MMDCLYRADIRLCIGHDGLAGLILERHDVLMVPGRFRIMEVAKRGGGRICFVRFLGKRLVMGTDGALTVKALMIYKYEEVDTAETVAVVAALLSEGWKRMGDRTIEPVYEQALKLMDLQRADAREGCVAHESKGSGDRLVEDTGPPSGVPRASISAKELVIHVGLAGPSRPSPHSLATMDRAVAEDFELSRPTEKRGDTLLVYLSFHDSLELPLVYEQLALTLSEALECPDGVKLLVMVEN